MKTLLTITTTLGALTVSSMLATAGPVDARLVDQNATWIAHLDVKGLQQFNPELLGLHNSNWEEVLEATGIDVRHDLNGVTLYGKAESSNGVLVLQGTDALAESIDHIRQQPGSDETYSLVAHGGFDLHRFQVSEDDVTYAFIAPGERRGNRIAVLASDLDAMIRSIKVMRGDLPSLLSPNEDATPSLALDPKDGALLYIESHGLPWVDQDGEAESHIIRQSDRLALELHGQDDQFGIRARISTASESDAANIAGVLQGLLAVGRLAAREEPDLKPLVQLSRSIQIGLNHNDVVVEAKLPAKAINDAIRSSDINWDWN